MGGFVIDLKSLDVGILETGCLVDSSQLVIMPYGVELLIRCGYLPDIGKKEIHDKNKVDILSKSDLLHSSRLGLPRARDSLTLLCSAFLMFFLWRILVAG
jgi:hypothetical protein